MKVLKPVAWRADTTSMKNPIRVAAALPIALALVLGACGGGDSKTSAPANADGDKTAFCATNLDITNGLTGATSADDLVSKLTTIEPMLVGFAANAPAAVKVDAQTLVETAQKALSSKDGTGFADPVVVTAGKNVDTFCGISSSS